MFNFGHPDNIERFKGKRIDINDFVQFAKNNSFQSKTQVPFNLSLKTYLHTPVGYCKIMTHADSVSGMISISIYKDGKFSDTIDMVVTSIPALYWYLNQFEEIEQGAD